MEGLPPHPCHVGTDMHPDICAALVHAISWHLWPGKPASPSCTGISVSDLDVERSSCIISVEVSYAHKVFICLHGWLY